MGKKKKPASEGIIISSYPPSWDTSTQWDPWWYVPSKKDESIKPTMQALGGGWVLSETIEPPSNVTKKKTCKRCGFTYYGKDIDLAFHDRPNMQRHASAYYATCRLCEQDKRTGKTRLDRWKAKVTNTRRNHSKSLGIPIKKLEMSYGWVSGPMAHDAAHSYANGCTECHEPYEIMGNGLRDITLDIWDPRVEPSYGSNTRWICSSCNSAKGDMLPEEWAAYKRLWRERATFLAEQEIIMKPEQLEFVLWLQEPQPA